MAIREIEGVATPQVDAPPVTRALIEARLIDVQLEQVDVFNAPAGERRSRLDLLADAESIARGRI